MTRHTTTGNARPHIVHHGYQHSPRVPGPFAAKPEPKRYGRYILAALALLFTLHFVDRIAVGVTDCGAWQHCEMGGRP